MSDADRTAAEGRFREDFGCGERDAGLAARAQYPFDDGAEPAPGLRRDISDRVSHFVAEIDGRRGSAVGMKATRAIEEYLQLARDHRDMHYVRVFEDLLERTSGPVTAPEPGE